MPGVGGTPLYMQQQRLQFLYCFGLKLAMDFNRLALKYVQGVVSFSTKGLELRYVFFFYLIHPLRRQVQF